MRTWYSRRVDTETYLRTRWELTLQKAEATGASPHLIEEILEAYSGPGRYYHVRSHLRHIFETYDRFFSDPNNVVLELSIWYHDFVYDPKDKDNEERSADIAVDRIERRLQVLPNRSSEAKELILFSRYQRPPTTRNEMILQDVDLAIFGEEKSVFDEYERGIRQEYSFVPETEYKKGRAAILRRFLRVPFYCTTEMQFSSYETLAQMNILKAIDTLSV